MLKRQHRLKKQADFLCVFKEGKRRNIDSLIISERPNSLGIVRFGVVVSKKVSKKAVVRNKIRRSILAILEPYQQLSVSNDVVITVTKIPEGTASPYQYFLPIIRQWRSL